jgi:hypothetical protein
LNKRRYPWAAHYVPVPRPQAVYVRELFEELGVLQNDVWNERYLCFAPQERLFLYERWQEGTEPANGLSAKDRAQFQKFADLLAACRQTAGFTIPMELGLTEKQADLDKISFSAWLRAQGFD